LKNGFLERKSEEAIGDEQSFHNISVCFVFVHSCVGRRKTIKGGFVWLVNEREIWEIERMKRCKAKWQLLAFYT